MTVALLIALAKGALVALFFMHLWDQRGANRLVFATSLVFVALLIGAGDRRQRHPLPARQPARHRRRPAARRGGPGSAEAVGVGRRAGAPRPRWGRDPGSRYLHRLVDSSASIVRGFRRASCGLPRAAAFERLATRGTAHGDVMKALTLGTKVFLLLLAAIALVGVTAAAGLLATATLNGKIDSYQDAKVPSLEALAELASAVADASTHAAEVEDQDADEAAHATAAKSLQAALGSVQGAAKAFEATPHTAAEAESWALVSKSLAAWGASLAQLERSAKERAAKADKFAEAAAAQHDVSAAYRTSRQAIQALLDQVQATARLTREAADRLGVEAERAQEAGRRWLLAVFAASVALLGAGGAWLAVGTRRTLSALKRETARLQEAVAAGRSDVRASAEGVGGEFAPVIDGMNETMDAFARPMGLLADYVRRIASGEIPPAITEDYRGDFNTMKESLNSCLATLGLLLADTRKLAQAAMEGRLAERADPSVHQGVFRKLLEGLNQTVATLVGHLDSVPTPAMVIDREMRIRFMNAAGARVLGKRQDEVVGKSCSELLRTGDCNTERCACAVAMRTGSPASSETEAQPGAAKLRIAYTGTPVRDTGGAVIGALEVFTDQTEIRGAMEASRRISEYQARAAEVVTQALVRLSAGDLAFDVEMEPGDQVTGEAQRTFEAIGTELTRSAAAVRKLIADVNGLAEAAVEGRLATRVTSSEHQGDFRKIVDGVNRTLDSVIAPTHEAARVLEQVAARDLRARVEGAYRGDHARMKDSVNAAAGALHEALAQVAQAVGQTSSAAAQIAASSQAVASGASEQASSLEATTSSIETISGMVKQASEHAQQASQLAQSARLAASDGAAAVEQMQGAMTRIKASAEGTSQIIRDINDIAFQTNLLALNAAVEAARAGEAGRGFAVVAEEVRSLALRAKEAATKTEELIRQSVKEAGEGEATARQVAGKLGEIASGVSRVTDIVAEIATASREQSTGIEQVIRAVSEMDKVTQQNAASAEESSSAASELSGQAEELTAMVAAFQLNGAEAPKPSARPRLQRAIATHPL